MTGKIMLGLLSVLFMAEVSIHAAEADDTKDSNGPKTATEETAEQAGSTSSEASASTSAESSVQGDASAEEQSGEPVPEEYREEEFSSTLRDLRRGEIVFFGSIPLTLFFAFEAYDLYRYFSHNRDPMYRPWPFQSPGNVPYSQEETTWVLITGLSLSLLIALGDFVIGRINEQRNPDPPGRD